MLTQWKECLADRLIDPDEIPSPLTLPDKWVGHSVLHKAIRRGDPALACAVGATLLNIDRSGIWRQLLTIAFEDVGIGDETAAITCAAVADDPAWRAKVGGDARVVATICTMLAEAVKERSSDELICAARSHPGLEEYREMAGGRPLADRLRLVEDTALPLAARAISAWYSSGVEWYPEKRVGPGDLDGLLETYQRLGATPNFTEATRIAVRRVRQPIVLFPALLSTVIRDLPSDIVVTEPPPSVLINGVPAHAFDRFTRTGKAAISMFAKRNTAIRTMLDGLVPDNRWSSVMAFAVFYAEGSVLTKRRMWRDTLELERLGHETDYLAEGISPDDFRALIDLTGTQLPDLNQIRARLAADADQPAHGQLL